MNRPSTYAPREADEDHLNQEKYEFFAPVLQGLVPDFSHRR